MERERPRGKRTSPWRGTLPVKRERPRGEGHFPWKKNVPVERERPHGEGHFPWKKNVPVERDASRGGRNVPVEGDASRGKRNVPVEGDVPLNDCFLWTFLCTFATANTLTLIDVSDIVFHMYSIVFTILLTKVTSNTAHRTSCHNVFTFIL